MDHSDTRRLKFIRAANLTMTTLKLRCFGQIMIAENTTYSRRKPRGISLIKRRRPLAVEVCADVA